MPEPEKVPNGVYDSIGDSGRWQVFIVLLMAYTKFSVGALQLSFVFLAPPVDYHCKKPNKDVDPCSENCKEVDYNREVFSQTAIMEWDLICDKEQLINVGQTIFMFGILLGNISFGILSDKVGRKIPLLISVVMQLGSGLLAAIVPWYWMFVLLRFITGVATGGLMLVSFCICMEVVGPSSREVLVSIIYQVPFNMGHMLLAAVGYFIRHFRWYQFALSISSVVCLSFFCLVPESPRWLMVAGRTEEAIKILEKAAKMNQMPTDRIRSNVEEFVRHIKSKDPVKKGNVLDLLRTPKLRKNTLCIFFTWFVVGYNYFGISQYVGQLGGNIFVNVALSALLGIPGVILSVPACKYLGRKPALAFANLTVGVTMGAFIFVPESMETFQVVLSSFSVFGAAMCFPTCYLYAGEIFPTMARNSGLGVASMIARIGAMIVVYTPSLKKHGNWIPPLIFCTLGILAFLLTLLLPETKGQPLPDTPEEAENYGKKQV